MTPSPSSSRFILSARAFKKVLPCSASCCTFIFALLAFAMWIPASAAEASRKPFDIPAGEARTTLREYSAQSGEQILFADAAAAGARTNPVRGTYTTREALDRLLLNSGLVALHDEQTGAIAVRRGKASDNKEERPTRTTQARLETGQTAGAMAIAADGETLDMNAFEVTTTAGRGYVARNTEGGMRANQPIFKMPQGITVLTRDFIDDLGYSNSSDIMRFGGAANFFQGESISIRGARVSNPGVDGSPDSQPYVDNIFIDSYEVLKGPIGGSINRNTKRPLRTAAHSVTVKADDNGMYRGEFDFTGPFATVGEGILSYRLVGAYQDGDTFLKLREDKREVIHPTFQYDYKNTTVLRIGFDQVFMRRHPNSNNFVTPEGKLFTGAGRDEGYFAAGGMEDFKRIGGRFTLQHRFAKEWDMEAEIDAHNWKRYGIALLNAGGVNWRDRTVGFISRQNSADYDVVNSRINAIGRYTLGPTIHQTQLGFRTGTNVAEQRYWASGQAFRRSIDDPQMNTVVLPARGSIPQPAAACDRVTLNTLSTSLRHSIDLFDERLYLVGSISYGGSDTVTRTNIGSSTAPVTTQRAYNWPYTYSASYKVFEFLSVYVTQSRSFGRQYQRDINGNTLPDQVTTGRDGGFKLRFRDGKFTASFAFFDTETTNQAVFVGVTPEGVSYSAPAGTTRQKGAEGDISAAITDNWQLMATWYKGETKDINGLRFANSYTGSWSAFTRYDFDLPALKGLSIGGGASRIDGRIVATSGVVFPVGYVVPRFITLDPEILMNAFAAYKWRNWTFRANVENLLDKAFPMGAQNAWIVDPSTPRSLTLSAGLTF